jgi:hypothetical protein
MLCLNCGRRSSDTKSFCEHCGAIASDESPSVAPPRPSQTTVPRRSGAASRPPASTPVTMRRTGPRMARSGSNPIPSLIFWGLVAYGGYWFLSDDGRDLRSLVIDLIEQQRQQLSAPAPGTSSPAGTQPAPAGSARPVAPAEPIERRTEPAQPSRPAASSAPARGTTRSPGDAPAAVPSPPARGNVPALTPQTTMPPAADPGVEGLSPAQVIQKLGRPASVVTVNGVTGWSYRDGSLIVYFVKDRATLKPPR